MAKNIDFMGATFPDVPSIRLPQHEGGLVSFDDTSDGNIQPADVTQGKIGYAQGQRVVGTATPSTPNIQSLSITENGTYTAPSGVDGYSPVTVNVPGIVPTGSQTFTENGTFDVTALAEAVINVAGGGGFTLLKSDEFSCNISSTTKQNFATIECGEEAFDGNVILYVKIRDKAGARTLHYYSTDAFLVNRNAGAGATASQAFGMCFTVSYNANNVPIGAVSTNTTTNAYGIWANQIDRYGSLILTGRYDSSKNYVINGTFSIDVYSIPFPDNDSPFKVVS